MGFNLSVFRSLSLLRDRHRERALAKPAVLRLRSVIGFCFRRSNQMIGRKPKFTAAVLAALWALCIVHCLVDSATAHWHFQESGTAHHHHPPVNDSHRHEHGEPVGGHSHDSEITQCCEMEARLSSGTSIERDPLAQPPINTLVSSFTYALAANLSTDPRIAPAFLPDEFIETVVAQQLSALRVPNAPPPASPL